MADHPTPCVLAIASGKGGVGKSLVAANVGIFLATLGRRVVLVDAAFGSANLHLFAGVIRPTRTLSECLAPDGPQLLDLAVPTSIPLLRLIGGASDPVGIAEPTLAQVARLGRMIRELPADWVVVDLASGTHPATLELFLGADIGMVVAVPDPTSIELMHRFLRAASIARLRRAGLGRVVDELAIRTTAADGGIPRLLDVYLAAVESRSPEIDLLRRTILGFVPKIVINSVRSKSDMEMGRAIATTAERRLGTRLAYLGHLEYDEAVWASTRRRRPLLTEHPETRIAKCFERVTRGLLAVAKPDVHGAIDLDGDVLPSDSHYELLDVPPTASFEDIRRANRRVRDIYGTESVAISGLYDPVSLEAVHRRVDLAYATLMDAAKRKEYDLELFPEGVPLPVQHLDVPSPSKGARAITRPDEAAAAGRPPMPDVGAATEFTGELLRRIREALGIELREIAERSKIGITYLQAIEAEAFKKLPAPVYVRGFLVEYARVLGLHGPRVTSTYLPRYLVARGLADGHD